MLDTHLFIIIALIILMVIWGLLRVQNTYFDNSYKKSNKKSNKNIKKAERIFVSAGDLFMLY
jgi:flagellar biogenesis protein FliO